jgi:hypothetical protein
MIYQWGREVFSSHVNEDGEGMITYKPMSVPCSLIIYKYWMYKWYDILRSQPYCVFLSWESHVQLSIHFYQLQIPFSFALEDV